MVEGKGHPSKCPQMPCAYDAKTSDAKGKSSLASACSAQLMPGRGQSDGRVGAGSAQASSKTEHLEGSPGKLWGPIHSWWVGHNFWSYLTCLLCSSLLITGGDKAGWPNGDISEIERTAAVPASSGRAWAEGCKEGRQASGWCRGHRTPAKWACLLPSSVITSRAGLLCIGCTTRLVWSEEVFVSVVIYFV